MLQDYEIVKKNTRLAVAFLQLALSLLVLYSAVLFIPSFIEDVQMQQNDSNEEIKIRVIANSSSSKDQQRKQSVVSNIQTFIHNEQLNFRDIHNFERIYQDIQKNHSDLQITMRIGDNLIPAKLQNGIFYPQNEYRSAVFIIGSGRGENWFCAVFPTLCSPPKETKKEKPSFFIYEWWQKWKTKNTQITENYTH